MESQVRVLHILGRLNRGGAELRTLELIRHFDSARYRFDFVCTLGMPGELDGQVRELGGEVYPIKAGPTWGLQLAARLRAGRYHVVHSHVHLFSGWALRVAARVGVPGRIVHLRTTSDGRGEGLRRSLQRAIFRRWIDRYATGIVGVSRAALELGWRRDWESDSRCQVVYNGFDPAQFAIPSDRDEVRREFGLPVESTLCIHVGRMDAAKNHARLVRIFAALRRMRPDAALLIVGERNGEIEAAIRAEAAATGAGPGVRIAGNRADAVRLMKAADVMIFPSRREGLPGAVLEAAAVGLPVVASNLPGVLEIAAHFPCVFPASLDEGDPVWARAALDAVAAGVSGSSADFSQTAFAMPECVRSIEQIYASAMV